MDVLESLIEAIYARDRRAILDGANLDMEKLRVLLARRGTLRDSWKGAVTSSAAATPRSWRTPPSYHHGRVRTRPHLVRRPRTDDFRANGTSGRRKGVADGD